jgi:quinol monooxygenase YgiN
VIPPLPWKSFAAADGDSDYLVMASSLPLLRLTATLRFFRFVRAIRAQLSGSDGLVGYSLWAKPLQKRYWTLSVWRDEAALASFMNALPHVESWRSSVPTWAPRGSSAGTFGARRLRLPGTRRSAVSRPSRVHSSCEVRRDPLFARAPVHE